MINDKLKKYEKSILKSNSNLAMIEYIKKLIKEFENLNKSQNNKNNNPDDKEIFSNSLIIKELKELKDKKVNAKKESFMNLIEKIKKNYFEIRKIILLTYFFALILITLIL